MPDHCLDPSPQQQVHALIGPHRQALLIHLKDELSKVGSADSIIERAALALLARIKTHMTVIHHKLGNLINVRLVIDHQVIEPAPEP